MNELEHLAAEAVSIFHHPKGDTPVSTAPVTPKPKPTPAQIEAAILALITVLDKIVATATVDISNPLNLLNFAADLALWGEMKTAYADAKVVLADIKEEL